MKTKRKYAVWIVVAAIGLAMMMTIGWLGLPIRVSVETKVTLVGPDEEAINLLFQGASLGSIQRAVQRAGKPVDQVIYRDKALLYWAVDERRPDVVAWLLKQGADPDGTSDNIGGAPLEAAIVRRDVGMVERLIAAGADPDRRFIFSTTTKTPREYAYDQPAILAVMPHRSVGATRPASEPADKK